MEVDALHTTSSVIDFKAMAEAQSNDPPQEGGAQLSHGFQYPPVMPHSTVTHAQGLPAH